MHFGILSKKNANIYAKLFAKCKRLANADDIDEDRCSKTLPIYFFACDGTLPAPGCLVQMTVLTIIIKMVSVHGRAAATAGQKNV
jgi:hypothetical protein